jgi:hypothetical protein
MNVKMPPGVTAPPLRSVESALSYKVSGVLKDAPCDDYEIMAAHIELQRPLIEARRREAQAINAAQIGELSPNLYRIRVTYVNFVKLFYTFSLIKPSSKAI